ncbi:YHYH domain-containing protein [Cupriavidus necator]|uniref:YHYH domain-containing protein n=1 Tax=Cupriavidus necator TaxID=106590 RepID=UPI0035932DB2
MRQNFRRTHIRSQGRGHMKIRPAQHLRCVLDARKCVFAAVVAGLLFTGTAYAHGGGLDADGCHTNRKTGENHCHRGGSRTAGVVPGPGPVGVRSANSFVSTRSASSRQSCYTGPRGGTYTLTASGRKNYGGC